MATGSGASPAGQTGGKERAWCCAIGQIAHRDFGEPTAVRQLREPAGGSEYDRTNEENWLGWRTTPQMVEAKRPDSARWMMTSATVN